MTRYLVFEPGEAREPSEKAVFVRDRFSAWAFLFAFLWLLRYRLWLEAFLFLALAIGIGFLGEVDGFGGGAAVLAGLLALLVALEGPSLRAARYRRKGWREAAAFQAENGREAEILYYAGRSGPAAAEAVAAPSAAPMLLRRPPVPGRSLFDVPKAR